LQEQLPNILKLGPYFNNKGKTPNSKSARESKIWSGKPNLIGFGFLIFLHGQLKGQVTSIYVTVIKH